MDAAAGPRISASDRYRVPERGVTGGRVAGAGEASWRGARPLRARKPRPPPPKLLGEVEAAAGSGLDEGHPAGVREGAPPPTPPRSFLAERGGVRLRDPGSAAGIPLASARAPSPRPPPPLSRERGRIRSRSRRVGAVLPSPAQFAGEGRGGGARGRRRAPFDAPRSLGHHPSPAVWGRGRQPSRGTSERSGGGEGLLRTPARYLSSSRDPSASASPVSPHAMSL
jgi:hypothetical protein